MGKDLSDKITINHGVPQGSVLEPLIFLLYVNDFSEKLEGENDIVQFADDTIIICKFESKNNPLKIFKKTIEQADKSLTGNQLTLNENKAEVILYKY